MIQLFSPTIGQAELAQISQSFSAGWIGKGPKVAEFEIAWAKHIGANPANVVSTNSCTEALFAAVKLLGISPGDEVIIPTIHFIGAAQAVLGAGARPVFCDVNSRTLNTTTEYIAEKITNRTRAIILNHYGGVSCDMGGIMNLLYYHPRIKLIEDAACAPASTYNGRAVGTFGDIGTWSFDAMKIITTGDGGMMYVKDNDLAERARRLFYLGTDTASGLSSDKDRWWEFTVNERGARRSVMNDIAAGMGLEQLKKLDGLCKKRKEIAGFYYESFLGLNNQLETRWHYPSNSSYYFYWIQTPRRDALAAYLKAQGIYTSFRYYPLHKAYGLSDSLPNAEKAAETTLLLPLHCNLSDDNVSYICERVREFFK